MTPLKVILLANWGIGLTILKELQTTPGIAVVRVVTARGTEEDPWSTAVHNHAVANGLPVTDQDIKRPEAIRRAIQEENADLLVVHAYPRKLPRNVFDAPKLKSINIHPSLLPHYRGSSPTRKVLEDGATETGLTAHFMDENFDTGDVIHQERIPVYPEDTIETVIERLKKVVPALIQKTVASVSNPEFKPTPQKRMFLGQQPCTKALP